MKVVRAARVVPILMAAVLVPAAVAFLVVSVGHLIASDTAYHVHVIARPASMPVPTDAEVARLLGDQNLAGVQAMVAVAAVAASLVLTLIAWLLAWQRADARRRT